jgi:hypothetical protein
MKAFIEKVEQCGATVKLSIPAARTDYTYLEGKTNTHETEREWHEDLQSRIGVFYYQTPRTAQM